MRSDYPTHFSSGKPYRTRAINVDLLEADVITACEKFSVPISAIEPLASGGTHFVCTRGEGADEMRLRLKDHLIHGAVRRTAFYRTHRQWQNA